jgi:chondroitin AC lyase
MDEDTSQPTPSKRARTQSVILAAAAGLILIAFLAYRLYVRDPLAPRPEPGDPAPEFTLTTFELTPIALQDLRGQFVVLYFWASWSTPCRREATGLEALWQSYRERGVTLVGIPYKDAESASTDFLREYSITYPNGADPLGRIRSAYGVTQVPEVFIIDPDGQVAWTRAGEFSADELEEQLSRLVGGEAVRSPATTIQDIDIVAQRLRDELTAGAVSAARARKEIVRLAADGHWHDIDYDDKARTHWSPAQHTHRLARLAAAYRAHLYSPTEADELEQAILAALGYWVEHDPKSDNWWFNSIDTPKYLGQTLLLMDDTIPKPVWEQAVAIVRRSGFTRTGANLTWEAGNLLVLACATRDQELLERSVNALESEIRITTEEGIQPDFSFHQHGPQLYMSNYGELFSTDNSRYAQLLAGTAYALDEDQMYALSGLIREGQQWFIWGRQFDYHAMGRQLDRSSATYRGRAFVNISQRMAIADPAHADEYADFAARVSGAQPPGSSGPRGNRYFWRSDVMVHRPGTFYASVRMHSKRTAPTEVRVNRENLKGYHLSDGVTFLMQRGDEYHDIQPVWDWRKLPGTTCRETDDPLPYGRSVPERGNTTFVGGASDGQSGVAAMIYIRDGVQARKAWFFLPDGWVALGAEIRGETEDPLTTSINQCLHKSDVLLLREGRAEPLDVERRSDDDLEGVYHDGVGYYLLKAQTTVVSAASQTGTWASIEEHATDSSTVTQDVFSLWIEHGQQPIDGVYAYRIVPGLSEDEFAAYQDQAPVKILANTPHRQAIAYKQQESTLLQATFYTPGRLEVTETLSIQTDIPCPLVLKQTEKGITLSVSDPTQMRQQVQVRLTGHYAGPNTAYLADQDTTVVTIELLTDNYAGQTVQVRLDKV